MLKKFKSFEEASQDLWEFHPGPEYYERVRRFYEFAAHFIKRNYPKGIFKFKTIEEANRHREECMKNYEDKSR
jgi:hypothetical protein